MRSEVRVLWNYRCCELLNMLCRYPPYFDDQPFGIYEKILSGKIDWPRHVDPIARYVCWLPLK